MLCVPVHEQQLPAAESERLPVYEMRDAPIAYVHHLDVAVRVYRNFNKARVRLYGDGLPCPDHVPDIVAPPQCSASDERL